MEHNYSKNGPSVHTEGPKRVTKYCSVPQCNSYYRKGLGFHAYPKDDGAKRKWEVALKMGKPATATMLVCGKHFVPSDYFPSASNKMPRLFPHAVPSQKLPHRSVDKSEPSPRKRARIARTTRVLNRDFKRSLNCEIGDQSADEIEVTEEISSPYPGDLPSDSVQRVFLVNKSTQANLIDERTERITHEEGFSFADMIAELNALDSTAQVHLNSSSHLSADSDHASSSKSINLAEILMSDSKLYTFTGIHSLEMHDALVECVAEIDVFFVKQRKVIFLKDCIVMTMVKIKMNMDFSALAILFGITRQTCTSYFHHMCVLLARVLEVVIPWPEQEEIRCNLPSSFENYLKTRIILDCAETPVSTCRCLKCRVLTYSQYKKKHAAKYCVGIAPSGLITHISCSFGGRASDKFIVNHSKILDKLEPNYAVMVDKGFSIETECLERQVKFIRPPFLRQKKKLSREDALLTADIAKARVHVERVIQRLREYDLIRGPIPWHMAGYFDKCLIIVAGLTNLGPPVMNIDKFCQNFLKLYC